MSPVVSRAAGVRPAVSTSTSAATQKTGAPAAARAGAKKKVPGAKKIVQKTLPGFSRQLSAMLSAGMPILASLEAMEEQADNPNFKYAIGQIKRNIENGAAFSDALRQFPSVFDDLYRNMVKGGESGGQLPETIARLAGFLESSAKLRRKVKSAMMYPAIVMCLALTIATALVVFVVPIFADMFAGLGGELPGPTRALMNLSNLIRHNGLVVVLLIAGLVIAFKKWKATPTGGFILDRLALRLPVFGDLNKKVASSRFARMFGQLIRSGVPILTAIDIVAGATGNKVAGNIVLSARGCLEKGEPLSNAMLTQTVFPIMLVRMLQAGEKTGKIDEMMDNIANFYDDEVETTLAGLTSLLEPLLMVILGVLIGGIVVCLFLPIFKIGEIVQKG
ncbi:MAG: type II secretion system F family protein [Verrucomicrobiota bacterium]|nr:type II secretion system F family protein [Verrucomicrobiota bacterium]